MFPTHRGDASGGLTSALRGAGTLAYDGLRVVNPTVAIGDAVYHLTRDSLTAASAVGDAVAPSPAPGGVGDTGVGTGLGGAIVKSAALSVVVYAIYSVVK